MTTFSKVITSNKDLNRIQDNVSAAFKALARATVLASAAAPIAWVLVTPSMSPYQALVTSPFLAIDSRAGSGTINLWVPTNATTIIVSDVYGNSGAQPWSVVGQGGWKVSDPTAPGSYVTTGVITVNGKVVRYRPDLVSSLWRDT